MNLSKTPLLHDNDIMIYKLEYKVVETHFKMTIYEV